MTWKEKFIRNDNVIGEQDKMTLITEDKLGSACSGSDGDSNRTLQLDYVGTNNSIVMIVVNNSPLNAPDYTHNSTINTVTFTNEVYDAFVIRVVYSTDDVLVTSGDTATYAGTAELIRYMGYTTSTKPDIYTATVLQDALNRAQAEIDRYTQSHFCRSTDTTPDWATVTNEKHRGKGNNDRNYYGYKGPVATVTATLSSAVASSGTTVPVTSTNGFPSSGIVTIDGNKVVYTSKTSTTFTGCTGVSSAIDSGKTVYPYVMELSTTEAGSSPTWTVMSVGDEFDCEPDISRLHVYRDDFVLDVYGGNNPPKIPNRIRLSYMYGYDTIPLDIKRCCLDMAAKELMYMTVRKSHGEGSDGFNPSMVNVSQEDIKNTLDAYRVVISSNV